MCPADIPNCLHIAVIEQLQVDCAGDTVSLVYPTKIQCLAPHLWSDFISIKATSTIVAIPAEHILFQCFDISTLGVCLLTALVNESEVVK